MGNHNPNKELLPYGQSQHPIHGMIPTFVLKSEACKFIMKITQKMNENQMMLIKKLSQENHHALIHFYDSNWNPAQGGNEHGQMQSQAKEKDVEMYWEFFNWDLEKESKYLLEKGKKIS